MRFDACCVSVTVNATVRCLPGSLWTGTRIWHQTFVDNVLNVNGAILGNVYMQIVKVGVLLGGEFNGFSDVVG